jgi:hypothetical protein
MIGKVIATSYGVTRLHRIKPKKNLEGLIKKLIYFARKNEIMLYKKLE